MGLDKMGFVEQFNTRGLEIGGGAVTERDK